MQHFSVMKATGLEGKVILMAFQDLWEAGKSNEGEYGSAREGESSIARKSSLT